MISDQIINKIGDFFLKDYEKFSDSQAFGLLSGDSGILLLQAIFFKSTNDRRFSQELEHNLNRIITNISQSHSFLPTFCDGLAGVGWVLLYLKENKMVDLESEVFFEDVDTYLSTSLDVYLKSDNWDLLHGALGMALYFLKRDNTHEVDKVITFLEHFAEENETEIKWRRYDSYYLKFLYDFGFAHGIGGITYFLAKCSSIEIFSERCEILLKKIFKFYFNNIQDQKKIGSYFCNFKDCDEYEDKQTAEFTRLGWCYGDLGVLYALYFAATKLQDEIVSDKVLKMLKETAERLTYDESQIKDTSFCHGSSGAGLIFNHLYNLTNELAFKTASDYWENVTVTSIPDTNFDFTEMGQLGLLNGLAGVGIFLISKKDANLLHAESKAWKEAFFLV